MSITCSKSTFINEFGFESTVLVERNPKGSTLVIAVDIVEDLGGGVQIIRRTVTSNGFPPKDGSESDLRLRIDFSVDGTPSPIEHDKMNALGGSHIDDLLAAAERFGAGKPHLRKFLVKTHGFGSVLL